MKKFIYILLILNLNFSLSQELIIGEERVDPGIVFIFEGAVKDHVMPSGMHLKEAQTNIHIEARLLNVDNTYNWGETIEIISFNIFDCVENEDKYYLFSNNNISDVLLKNFSENKELFSKNNKNEIGKVIIIYQEIIKLVMNLIKEFN